MDYLNTHKIGDIGEAFAVAMFTQFNVNISIPFTQNVPYDLIAEFNGALYKIQVKTTESVKNGTMSFKMNRMSPFTHEKIPYSKEEVDYFFLYCIETGWCGLVKIEDCSATDLKIHYNSPKNNNYNGYRMFDDYDFCRRIDELRYNTTIPLIKRETNKDADSIKLFTDEIPGRTNREKLKEEIRIYSFTEVSKMYNVTDNAIRKWCKRMGLPDKSTQIKQYTDEEWEKV